MYYNCGLDDNIINFTLFPKLIYIIVKDVSNQDILNQNHNFGGNRRDVTRLFYNVYQRTKIYKQPQHSEKLEKGET